MISRGRLGFYLNQIRISLFDTGFLNWRAHVRINELDGIYYWFRVELINDRKIIKEIIVCNYTAGVIWVRAQEKSDN